jgi:hypothetical protein
MRVYVGCSDMVVPYLLNPPPYRSIECPIIGQRVGQLKVIAPNGAGKFVWPDGYLTRPKPFREKRYGC